LVERIIPPGNTEEFFRLDLSEYEAFDWNVKTLYNGQRGIEKISSIYTGTTIESTTYAVLGELFSMEVNISISVDDYCIFEITNNELLPMKCGVKVRTF